MRNDETKQTIPAIIDGTGATDINYERFQYEKERWLALTAEEYAKPNEECEITGDEPPRWQASDKAHAAAISAAQDAAISVLGCISDARVNHGLTSMDPEWEDVEKAMEDAFTRAYRKTYREVYRAEYERLVPDAVNENLVQDAIRERHISGVKVQ
jgi:hypothetical protein